MLKCHFSRTKLPEAAHAPKRRTQVFISIYTVVPHNVLAMHLSPRSVPLALDKLVLTYTELFLENTSK
jgi:hypothetical protein